MSLKYKCLFFKNQVTWVGSTTRRLLMVKGAGLNQLPLVQSHVTISWFVFIEDSPEGHAPLPSVFHK